MSQVPPTYKAAILPEAGAQLQVADRSFTALEPGEVAIRITATAINPVDWKIRDYRLPFIPSWPTVLGSDAAGEIAAVGPGDNAEGFKVGDRVFFQGILGRAESCTFQQYCKMPAALVSKTPSNVSDDEVAGVQLASVACVTAFYDKTGRGLAAPWDAENNGPSVGKGKAVVIVGGSSSVGQYAIQFARKSGFERIITNASPAHHEHLKKLGAHVVLDRNHSQASDFAAALDSLPLEFVFDTISNKDTMLLAIDVLHATKTPDAQVVTVMPPSDEAVQARAKDAGVKVNGVLGLGSTPALRHLSEPMVRHLGGEDGWIAKGEFVPNRPVVVDGGLAAIEAALKKNKEGVSGQKVIIHPWE